MNKDELKAKIVQKVRSVQGCKMMELVTNHELVVGHDYDLEFVINELINENELVEVEYALPNMDYRIKSFILPGGTKVKVRVNKNNKDIF